MHNASLNGWKENKCIINLPETVGKDKTWEWTRKDVLKASTEALILQLKDRH